MFASAKLQVESRSQSFPLFYLGPFGQNDSARTLDYSKLVFFPRSAKGMWTESLQDGPDLPHRHYADRVFRRGIYRDGGMSNLVGGVALEHLSYDPEAHDNRRDVQALSAFAATHPHHSETTSVVAAGALAYMSHVARRQHSTNYFVTSVTPDDPATLEWLPQLGFAPLARYGDGSEEWAVVTPKALKSVDSEGVEIPVEANLTAGWQQYLQAASDLKITPLPSQTVS